MRRHWASGWIKGDLRMLGSGQLDAGFAALAGFIAAAFAVRNLTADQLGIYSLLFLAFGVASQIPTQLVLSPAEVVIAHSPADYRLGSLRWSLPRGTLVAALASVTVAAGVLPLAEDVDLAGVIPLILTAMTFTLFSPIQDHIRRVLHIADRSGQASVISAVNLVVTTAAAIAFLAVDPLWVPFGSMTIGNVISCCAVLIFARGASPSPISKTRQLVSIGRYLLAVGLANSGGKYLAGTLVGAIAGPAALGYVEAARLVARPSEVSAMGVLAATGPRLMVSSANRERHEVKRLSRTYHAAVLTVGIAYTVLVATPVAWGIPREVFPLAYEVGGLVLAILVAQLVINLTRPLQARLMGLRQEVSLAVVEVVAQVGRLLASLSAFWVGGFGIPIGDFASHAYKLNRYTRKLSETESPVSPAHEIESEET